MNLDELTPFECRDGHWYKRDDLFRHPTGVNGGKWRQCLWLVRQMKAAGFTRVVSGASILSPQLPMTAVACREEGLACNLVIGGTTMERALERPGVRLAVEQGAVLEIQKVGYNPALQSTVRKRAAESGAGILRYGVTPDPESPVAELVAFHSLGARQVEGFPATVRTVVISFGSGNSAASVLWGLSHWPDHNVERVVLAGIGPDRWEWLMDRTARLEQFTPWRDMRVERWFDLAHYDLHGQGIVSYHQRAPYTSDGIVLHPTYEGKIARWLASSDAVPGWQARDGSVLFWNVGGPLPEGKNNGH